MLKAKIHVKAGLYPIDFVLNKLQSNISSVVDSLSSLTVPQITSQLWNVLFYCCQSSLRGNKLSSVDCVGVTSPSPHPTGPRLVINVIMLELQFKMQSMVWFWIQLWQLKWGVLTTDLALYIPPMEQTYLSIESNSRLVWFCFAMYCDHPRKAKVGKIMARGKVGTGEKNRRRKSRANWDNVSPDQFQTA